MLDLIRFLLCGSLWFEPDSSGVVCGLLYVEGKTRESRGCVCCSCANGVKNGFVINGGVFESDCVVLPIDYF